jgi:putative membrane protein
MGDWSLDPLQLAPIVFVGVAYGVRARTLERRGNPVPRWKIALFALGLLLLLVSVVSPVAQLGEERFSFHMVQHILLGDLAPLALLAGLYLWHLPFAYDAAIENGFVHAIEHLSFFTAGLIMWAPVVEVLPGPAWFGTAAKLGYIVVVRLVETVLANVFLWSGEVFYDPYASVGLSDQAAAGAIMMIEGSLVTFAAFAWLFLRMFAEGERKQELLEAGGDPRTVERAVRYGRADHLS